MTVVGFIDAGHDSDRGRVGGGRQLAVHPQTEPVPVLGQVDRLSEWVDRVGATDLVIALSGRSARRVRARIEELTQSEVRVHWISEGAARPGHEPAAAPPRHFRRQAAMIAPASRKIGKYSILQIGRAHV